MNYVKSKTEFSQCSGSIYINPVINLSLPCTCVKGSIKLQDVQFKCWVAKYEITKHFAPQALFMLNDLVSFCVIKLIYHAF